MAESGLSKAAKKNLKRRQKKGGDPSGKGGHVDDEFAPERLIPMLKEELDKAKAEKDFKKAGQLRDQIWVLTDLANGVKTDIPDEDLIPILNNLPMYRSSTEEGPSVGAEAKSAAPAQSQAAPQIVAPIVTAEDRKIRNLKKKLDQIEKLKERQAKGEKLESNQLEKIKSEEKTKEEIEELEDLIRSAMNFTTIS